MSAGLVSTFYVANVGYVQCKPYALIIIRVFLWVGNLPKLITSFFGRLLFRVISFIWNTFNPAALNRTGRCHYRRWKYTHIKTQLFQVAWIAATAHDKKRINKQQFKDAYSEVENMLAELLERYHQGTALSLPVQAANILRLASRK